MSAQPSRVFVSPSAAERLAECARLLAHTPSHAPLTLLVPSLAAAERLMLAALAPGRAVFAWQRRSFDELARSLALRRLSRGGIALLGGEAAVLLAQHAIAGAAEAGALGRFRQIAGTPGFAQALKGTLSELRLAGVTPATLAAEDATLAALLGAYEAELSARHLCDRAGLFRAACEALGEGAAGGSGVARPPWLARIVLYDVPLQHALEAELFAALVRDAEHVFASVVRGDERSEAYVLGALPGAACVRHEPARASQLDQLKARIFASEGAAPAGLIQNVQFVASPGEAREAVEAVRMLLARADGGVPFDRMAIVLRAAEAYRSVVEEALVRAEVPAYFAAGVARPRPEGRALLALLACARDGVPIDAFCAFVSLGVLPPIGGVTSARRIERVLRAACAGSPAVDWPERVAEYARGRRGEAAQPDLSADQALRLADGAALAEALAAHLPALLAPLERLSGPLSWEEALSALRALTAAALAEPGLLDDVWAELQPLVSPSPTSAAQLVQLLARRLASVLMSAQGRAAGRVYVGTPDDLRGLSFDTCFVLGLTEQLFPERPREDALLADALRRRLSPHLRVAEERVHAERVLLRLAIGAAEHHLSLSFPRFDPMRGRPRVPSFYGLEVLHAIDGLLPAFDALARRALPGAAARMGFPAPDDPAQAIDDAEYDLSVLGRLVSGPAEGRRGAARYLVLAHPHLGRALRFRARRWSMGRYGAADGFMATEPELRAYVSARALALHPYAATTLEALAACPYRFFLRAWLGLREAEGTVDATGLSPRLRGTLFHAAQSRLIRTLCSHGPAATAYARAPSAAALLPALLAEVVAEHIPEQGVREEPLVRGELAEITRDLSAWLAGLADERSFAPLATELGFGLPPSPARDPRSCATPVQLATLQLRGAIDLVESGPPLPDGRPRLRVTDTKTGRVPPQLGVLSGGHALQPVLYALAAEQLFPEHAVEGARLSFCTTRGDFRTHFVALDARTRAIASDYLGSVQQLIAGEALWAVPEPGACADCGYRSVCGPYEEERVARVKNTTKEPRLEPLHHLRSLP